MKDCVAADVAGYADEADDVASALTWQTTWQEQLTWKMPLML